MCQSLKEKNLRRIPHSGDFGGFFAYMVIVFLHDTLRAA